MHLSQHNHGAQLQLHDAVGLAPKTSLKMKCLQDPWPLHYGTASLDARVVGQPPLPMTEVHRPQILPPRH